MTVASIARGRHLLQTASGLQHTDARRHARFQRLCGAFRTDLFHFSLWLTRDRAIAEDVVQETLCRAWRFLDSLDDEGAARTWLLTIARREAARVFTRPLLATNDVDSLSPADEAALANGPSFELDELRQAIWLLPTNYREPLALHALLGCSTQEIATRLGLTVGAVLTRLHRARARLRLILGESSLGEGRRGSRSDSTRRTSRAA